MIAGIFIAWAIAACIVLAFNYAAHREPRIVDHDVVLADAFPEDVAS